MVRRVGLAVGVALGLVLCLIGAAFAFAQTGPGQRLIGAVLERVLSSPQTRVEVTGLGGFVPFDLHLAELRLADPEGVWLEAEGLRLTWSPSALLHGRVEVATLGADRINLRRPPPTAANDEPFRLPELPGWLPPIALERLSVPQIELGPEVLGEAATFSLTGRLAGDQDGRAVVLALDAERVDRPTARAALDARLGLDPAALELTLDASETGGLLARLTGRPEAGDFSLRLRGSGPLDAWTGDLKLDAAGLAQADAKLAVALVDQPKLHLDGNLRPAPGLLPDQLAGFLGQRLGLVLSVTQTAAQRLSVQDLRVATANGDLAGRADLDFERGQLTATADLDLPKLAPLSALVGTPLAGALSAHLVADGALLQPKGRLALAIEAPGIGQLAAERLQTTLDFTMPEPAAVQVSGTGRVAQLRPPPDLPLPAQDVTWRLALAGSAHGPLTLSDLALSAKDLKLNASGTLDPTTLGGRARVGLEAPALGPLTAPFGQRLDGRATLAADLKIGEGAHRIEASLTGDLGDLAGLPPGAAELLGPAPQLAAQATLEPDRRLAVEGLTITGAAATLGGNVALTLPEQTLDGRLTLSLPKLAVLAPVLRQDLAGRLEIEAVPGGSLAAPTVQLKAHGQDLVVAGRPIASLTLETSAKDLLTAPAGTLEVAAKASGLEAKVSSGYRLQDRRLELTDLRLAAPKASVGGRLAIDLDHALARGELKGDVGDLAAFAPLLPVRLAGQLKLETQLDVVDQRQKVALKLDAGGLDSDFGQVRRLRLDATVNDALGTPGIDANLQLDDVRRDQVVVTSATATARGSPADLALNATLEGQMPQPFKLDGKGGLSLGEPVRVRLAQLDGQLAGAPLRLAQPAELTIGGAGTRLAGLDLSLGKARLVASADLGARTVTADARLQALPLPLLAKFGGPALTGQADATLRLEGPADDPRGTLDLNVTKLGAGDPSFAGLPPATLTGRAELAARRLHVELNGRGFSERPVTLTAELPLIVRFDQARFELPPDGRLDGRVDARLELARLAALGGLDDQTLKGTLNVGLTLNGTIGAPGVAGTIEMQGGSYANGTTGTVLREISLRAQASERQIVVKEFKATDGGKGTLSGDGTVAIDPAAKFPLTLSLKMKDARLVRRDDVSATVSGQLALSGDFGQLKLGGSVTVERADIGIPDSTGPDVPVIAVKEVGGDRARGRAAAFERRLDTPDRGSEDRSAGPGVRARPRPGLGVAGQAPGDRPDR